jgi:hypothetical protein
VAASQATVDLIFQATNLAGGAVGELGKSIGKLGDTATAAAGKVGRAFEGTGRSLSVGLGAAVDGLVTGGGIGQAMMTLGGFMAGELTENFGGQLIERLASSSLISTITAPIAALGSAIGSIVAAAIPIGMALLPFLLIGALVAAVAVLVANPEIRGRVVAFVQGLVATLIGVLSNLLGALPHVIGAAFTAAWTLVLAGVKAYLELMVAVWVTLPSRLIGLGADIVRTIINGLSGLPGALGDAIAGAFRSLSVDVGPFHLHGGSFSFDAPDLSGLVPHFAVGTPYVPRDMLAVVHRGEAIIPARRNPYSGGGSADAAPGQAGGLRIEGVTQRQLEDMADRGLYFRLRRSAPSIARP